MSCKDIQQLLDAHLDRELDLLNEKELEAHLVECASCRAVRDNYARLHLSVKSRIPYFDLPEGIENRIRAQIHLAEGTREPRISRSLWPWRAWAAAAGIVLVAGLSTPLLMLLARSSPRSMLTQQVVSSHIRSLMAGHVTDVVSSDRHTVKPWFNGKLDFAPPVKDLSQNGFPLIGGRLDYIDNRSVAALIYKHREHIINLFIWPSSARDSNPESSVLKGYNLVHWTQSHMTYWAVSDLNMHELLDFARNQRKPAS